MDGADLTEEEKASVDSRSALAIARVNWMHQKYPIVRSRRVFLIIPGYSPTHTYRKWVTTSSPSPYLYWNQLWVIPGRASDKIF